MRIFVWMFTAVTVIVGHGRHFGCVNISARQRKNASSGDVRHPGQRWRTSLVMIEPIIGKDGAHPRRGWKMRYRVSVPLSSFAIFWNSDGGMPTCFLNSSMKLACDLYPTLCAMACMV